MSCLFNSLSYFLPNISSNELRQIICDYIKKNPTLIDGIETKDIIESSPNVRSLNAYVSNMSNTSTWGGGIEIKCFCDIFNAVVIVHFQGNKIEFIPNTQSSRMIELYYTGSHYEPTRG